MKFTAKQIAVAATQSRMPDAQFILFATALHAQRRKRGRPTINDSMQLTEMARLVKAGESGYGAATKVTEHLPPSRRTTDRRRLYRKFHADRATWMDLQSMLEAFGFPDAKITGVAVGAF